MSAFSAPDGTRLTYRASGAGNPVVCIAGGPTDPSYLGNLGGLSEHRQLIVLNLRGTGASGIPEDTTSYRCDRMVDDLEALRLELGLQQMDLLAHCAGANLAMQYAARHQAHVGRLALVTPSTRAVGIEVTRTTRRETALLRKDEPWFPTAFAALEAIMEGIGRDWDAIAPFYCGRWDEAARDHHAVASTPTNPEAARFFAAEGAFDPESTRAGLAGLAAPALLLAGEVDLNSPAPSVAELAGLLPHATLVVQEGAGHYPWLDDADGFVATVATFLG